MMGLWLSVKTTTKNTPRLPTLQSVPVVTITPGSMNQTPTNVMLAEGMNLEDMDKIRLANEETARRWNTTAQHNPGHLLRAEGVTMKP